MPLSRQLFLLSAIIVLGNLALAITRNSRVFLFEQAQCHRYYLSHKSSQTNHHNNVDESFCKIHAIQYPLSIIVGVDQCLTTLPGLLVLASFQQLLPEFGLRYLVILNLLCSAAGVLFSIMIFWTWQPWSSYVALLSSCFDLIGGGTITRITIIITCMANLASSEDLTKIYNYTSGMYLLADVAGAAINSLLLSDHVYLLNAISVSCFAVTAWIAMLIPEECARESITTEEAIPIVDSVDGFESSPTTSISLDRPVFAQQAKRRPHIISTLLNSWRASYHTLSTLFRAPNPTFTVLLLFAVNGFANNIQVLLFQYTSLVLSWPLATVNSALALKALVSAIMLLALPTFRKLILEPRLSTTSIDLLITQISLLLNALGMIGLGFSVSAILFIISLCVYTSGVGLGDSLTAYGTLTLPQHETVADFYVKTGLIQTITGLTAAPLWSLLFGLVIDARVLPLGIPFWLCATLYGCGVVGAGALRRWHVNTR